MCVSWSRTFLFYVSFYKDVIHNARSQFSPDSDPIARQGMAVSAASGASPRMPPIVDESA
jgi:hypothetical protein